MVLNFLDTVIEHLANRTTARERVSYHISESYKLKEAPVSYGTHQLPEADVYGSAYRALPPAEDMVLVAWCNNQAQLALAQDNQGLLYVRLGRRRGALLVHPNLARVRHILLRKQGAIVAPGLLKLREAGVQIFTRSALRIELQQHAKGLGVAAWEASAKLDEDENIYAVFRTRSAPGWVGQEWHSDTLMDLIEQFESDRRNRVLENLGRTSPNPRILPLQSVLMCLKK